MRVTSKAELSVALLMATIVVSLAALLAQTKRAEEVAIDRAIAASENLIDFVLVTQRQYTQNVAHLAISDMTAYPEREPHKVWLPVTFAMRYTDAYSKAKDGMDFKIYSQDPFPDQKDRVLDEFARNALDQLLTGDTKRFRTVETMDDGYKRVRLAVAFEMQEHCADCHNREEWGLNRRIWQVGDVRGAWEVSINVPPVKLYSQHEIFSLIFLMASACIMGFFIVLPSVRREVQGRAYFHNLSRTMENEALAHKLEAETDSLTGIGNRRLFNEIFPNMIDTQIESGENLAVILIDVDRFKAVNDGYGHDVGDQVLQTIAQLLKSQIRESDVLARLGGEEFVVLIPDLTPDDAITIAMRIRTLVEKHAFKARSESFHVTVSAGISFLEPEDTADGLLKRADDLLYRAKSNGRNKLCAQKPQQTQVTCPRIA